MALAELLVAVRDQLRLALRTIDDNGLLDAQIDVRGDGRPPASVGQEYIAIYPTEWAPGPSNNQEHIGLDEVYGFAITLTRRAGYVPDDRITTEIVMTKAHTGTANDETKDMHERMREILTHTVPYRYAIRQTEGETLEPFRWLGCDPWPQRVGPDWFSAESDDQNAHGFTWTARFGGARRLAKINDESSLHPAP